MTEAQTPEKLFEKVVEEMDKHLEGKSGAHAFLGFLKSGLENLQDFIEAGFVSWDSPAFNSPEQHRETGVELQYPFFFDFMKAREAFKEEQGPIFNLTGQEIRLDRFFPENLPKEETDIKNLVFATAEQVAQDFAGLSMLQAVTNGIIEYRDSSLPAPPEMRTRYIVPNKVMEELNKEGLQGEERVERIDELVEPFVPPEPLIFKGGNEAGLSFSVKIIFEIHTPIADADENRAYFPIVVGLEFTEGNPKEWSEEDAKAFWEELFQEIQKLQEEAGKPIEKLSVPEPRRFPLSPGSTLLDKSISDFISHAHKLSLPRKWSNLPSWETLVDQEIQRILEEYGDEAFEDIQKKNRDPKARGPLLKRGSRGGEPLISLTSEAEKSLKIQKGLGQGYRYLDPKTKKEYFTRLFQVGGGYLEVGFSWYGMAGPLVEEWRERFQEEADKQKGQTPLFDLLDTQEKEKVDRLVSRARSLTDARELMEVILGQVGRQGRNPVQISALAFRHLLNLENNPNWKSRVDAALEALRACEFRLDSFDTGKKQHGYGAFIGEWFYRGQGPGGGHGEGYYFLNVQPGFIGCLSIFETAKRKLPAGTEITFYDFGRRLTPEDKKFLGWKDKSETAKTFISFDSFQVFYDKAQGLTPEQKNLHSFLEREITLKRDPVSRKNGIFGVRKRVDSRKKESQEPRVYDQDFCPLLPQGRLYHAALGHFRRNPESGRTLYGTRSRSSATGGGHTEGLISTLGYSLPPGAASSKRVNVLKSALQDFKAVVVDYLDGVIAARDKKGNWLTLEEASKLEEQILGKEIKWYFFLPETWKSDRPRKWEETQQRRAEKGETPYAWKIQDPNPDQDPGGLQRTPLYWQLRAARVDRGLTQEEVGKLFGVSKMTISFWERGTEPDEDGRIPGKPIPRELEPLVKRWIETGEPPSPEDLASRKTRRTGLSGNGGQ